MKPICDTCRAVRRQEAAVAIEELPWAVSFTSSRFRGRTALRVCEKHARALLSRTARTLSVIEAAGGRAGRARWEAEIALAVLAKF